MRRLLLGLLLAVACGGSDSTTAPVVVSALGTWSLSTVNGSPLPYVVAQSGTNKAEVIGGSLTVSASSYAVTLTGRNTVNGVASTSSGSDAGTYSTNGTAITLRSNSDGSTITGSFAANALTLTEQGGAYVFTR